MSDSEQRCRVRPLVWPSAADATLSVALKKLVILSRCVICPRAKRYERMMKFHGVYQPHSGARETFKLPNAKEPKSQASTPPATKATEKTSVDPPSATKRPRKNYKGFDGGSCNLAMDDDEGLVPVNSGFIKTENVASTAVKEESQAGEYHGMGGFRYPLAEGGGGGTGEESANLPSGFLQPQDFEQQNGSDSDAFDVSGHGFPALKRRRPGNGSEIGSDFVILD